jgi:SAM-dependent methyltransferase
MAEGHDAATIAFYDQEAPVYAARQQDEKLTRLGRFLDALSPGASILELGCGGGRDAAEMLRRGFDVTPTDGSPGMAAEAERRLGRPVRVMRFEDLDAEAAYDAVWANASLLHAPADALASILAKVRRALRPGGRFLASFKAGDGPARDRLGRYYNFPSEAALRAAYAAAGPWSLEIDHAHGGGYDGVARDWLICLAVRA